MSSGIVTKGTPSFTLITSESKDSLAKVPDYPLDYNIYVFLKIKRSRDNLEPKDLELFKPIHNEQANNTEYLTKTAEMHDRLLQYLVLERKRREKIVLKTLLEDSKAKEEDSSKQPKIDYTLQLLPTEEKDILNYKIKSPLYNSFDKHHDENVNFKKLSMIQNVEYQFEEGLNDDELIELFVNCEEFSTFEGMYSDLRNINKSTKLEDQEEVVDEEIKKIMDKLMNENIVRLLLPLAGQAVLADIDVTKSAK